MTTSASILDLIASAGSREGVVRLLGELGIPTAPVELPREAWSAYGLTQTPDVARVVIIGRAGSLEALLFELAEDADATRCGWIARRVRSRNPACLHLYVFAAPRCRRLTLAVFSLEDALLHVAFEPEDARPSDVETVEEMVPPAGEEGLALALRYARALDRSRVTGRFFADFRARRAAIAAAWTGLPADADRERAQLALLFLCRLTFLYFVQHRGALAGDPRYLPALFGRWAAAGPEERSFYRGRLIPLFFDALNRRPEQRPDEARALGPLPYLNGGLFERHAFERRFPDLDLPDDEVRGVLEGLLERYRFTTRETEDAAAGVGIDPEILGRVFEGLMAPDQRTGTGSYYTPAPVVRRVVREALTVYLAGSTDPGEAQAVADGNGETLPAPSRYRLRRKLERVRVLDPACGSGAFLLGALGRLAHAMEGLGGDPEQVRRAVVARSLHGVDLLDDAALLCSLRLWLALSAPDHAIRPLPNLDRRIRQGDALIDPLDLGLTDGGRAGETPSFHPLLEPETRRALRAVEPAALRYLRSGPEERERRRSELADVERELARRWIDGARRAERDRLRSLSARAGDRDLFGERSSDARRSSAAIPAVQERLDELEGISRALDDRGSLPFFSFGVHFAEAPGGFDLILSNPPWIRSHHWPARLRSVATRRFEVCRDPGWAGGAALARTPSGAGSQVDLSLLFVERAIRLLAPGGVLAILIPAKAMRALYGGGIRRILLRDLDIAGIEDHSLDQRSIFRADAFAVVLIARKRGAEERPDPRKVRVHLERRGEGALRFETPQSGLSLLPDDPASPWLIAPPEVVSAMRAMQAAGPPLGHHDGLRVRRGVMTGANGVLLVREAQLKLGGLARIEAEGHVRTRRTGGTARAAGRFRGYIETGALRPLVRGADIDAFRYRTEGYVIWCHDGAGAPKAPPPRAGRYLLRHRQTLESRAGWREPLPLGVVFRLSADTLRPKVAWHDLADTLKAVALPRVVAMDGCDVELIPLNTLYFLPVDTDDDAVLLAGLLNSLPARVFTRVLAERAKDARFRFFAWTLSCLPLPPGWRERCATDIREISAAAHLAGGIGPEDQARLDRLVAELYGLNEDQVNAMRRFDLWLKGVQ